MNPAITAALIAAQESQPPGAVERLTKAGATSRDKAIAIDPASPAEAKLIDDAIGLGLVQRRGDGRLFVNQHAVAERNSRIGAWLLIGTLIALSILASAAALLIFAH